MILTFLAQVLGAFYVYQLTHGNFTAVGLWGCLCVLIVDYGGKRGTEH